MPKVIHPHITSDSRVCGGGPVIVGTRFTVRSVVVYVLHRALTLAQSHDVLAYYCDNRDHHFYNVILSRQWGGV